MSGVLAVVPARGGSKGIPGKNLIDLGGRPLLDWTLDAAFRASSIDEVLVSSEDPAVLDHAGSSGATVHRRPDDLAADHVHAVHVAIHVVESWPLAGRPDVVVMLLPTGPFRRPEDIDGAVRLHESEPAPAVISVTVLDKQLIHLRSLDADGTLVPLVDQPFVNGQRQDQPRLYGLNGSLYVMRADRLCDAGTFHVPGARPWVMSRTTSLDINEPADLEEARRMVAERVGGGLMTGRRLAHIGIHESRNRNAGDTLLFEEVRNCIGAATGDPVWENRQLWDPLDVAGAEYLNALVDGVVVGGGGLLLRDQAGSDTLSSGWQWNATVDAIGALEVPLIVFAIGYNRFRGQPDFDPVFTEHITAVVEQAAFVGLRNTGSIHALCSYLPPALHDRIRLQPCPTTLLWYLHEELSVTRGQDRPPMVRVNVAFDRAEMRFPQGVDAPLAALSRALLHAAETGWKIRVTSHKSMDHEVLPHLVAAGVPFEVDDLTGASPTQIIDAYRSCDLSLGLRGHAQMIPFGLRRPIITIETHDKMRWFLEDLGHPEWGVDVGHPALADELCDRIDAVRAEPEIIVEQLATAQNEFWALTRANLRLIARSLDGANDRAPRADWTLPPAIAAHGAG